MGEIENWGYRKNSLPDESKVIFFFFCTDLDLNEVREDWVTDTCFKASADSLTA